MRPPPPPRGAPSAALPFPSLPPSRLSGRQFRFLDEERTVGDGYEAEGASALWTYNLHYFDGLHSLSTDDGAAWLTDWTERVSPGSRPAWDPYPVSRRISNWVKWAIDRRRRLPAVAERSLASQVRWLRGRLEYHLMANHLLANSTALTMAGLYFGGAEGDAWLEQGRRLLDDQLEEQILPDGGHYELSPVYHAVVLQDLLDLLNVYRSIGLAEGGTLRGAVERAVAWLSSMTMSDGRLPLLNDAAYGVALEPGALLEYAGALGLPLPVSSDRLTWLKASGYVRYRQGAMDAVVDVGPPGPDHQPGHAHCDMLGFSLWWAGAPLIVDTGTSTYDAGPRRLTERGTAAHNTVQVGGREQSEIWASFRMARRARIRSVRVEGHRVAAEARGFPPAWTTHRRTFDFAGESLRIDDDVATDESCVARLHFHPDVRVRWDGVSCHADGLRIVFEGATRVDEVPYLYAPRFNRTVPATSLDIAFTRRLSTRIERP